MVIRSSFNAPESSASELETLLTVVSGSSIHVVSMGFPPQPAALSRKRKAKRKQISFFMGCTS